MDQNVLATAIIIGYMALMLILGFYMVRFRKGGAGDFYIWGRSMPNWLTPFTVLASMMSAATMIGFAGMYYSRGLGALSYVYPQIWAMFLFLYLGFRIWASGKYFNYITVGDFMRDRFNSKFLQRLVAFVLIIFTLPYLTLQCTGCSKVIAAITNDYIKYEIAVLMIVFLTGLYTFLGGVRAIVITDLIQIIIALIGIISVVFIVIFKIGGFAFMFREAYQVRPQAFSAGGFSPVEWISISICATVGLGMHPSVWARWLSTKNEKGVYGSAVTIGAAILIYGMIYPIIAITAGIVAFGNGLVENPDNLIPNLLRFYLPISVASLIMAGTIAAAQSTIDSFILVCSQMITEDFFTPSKWVQKFSQKQKDYVRHFCILGIILIAGVASLFPPKLILVLGLYAWEGWALLVPPFIAGFYWKRINKYGIAISLIIALIILLGAHLSGIDLEDWIGLTNFLTAFIVEIILLISLGFLLNPNSDEIKSYKKINGFFNKVLVN